MVVFFKYQAGSVMFMYKGDNLFFGAKALIMGCLAYIQNGQSWSIFHGNLAFTPTLVPLSRAWLVEEKTR